METKKQSKKPRSAKYEEKASFNGTFDEFLDIAIGKVVEPKAKLKTPKK